MMVPLKSMSELLTDEPDHVQGGIGQDGRVQLIEAVVGLLPASQSFPRHAG